MEYKYTIVKIPKDEIPHSNPLGDELYENYDSREEAEAEFEKLSDAKKKTHTIVEVGYQKPKGE